MARASFVDVPDHCSPAGATMLADRIKAFWQAQGYNGVKTRVVESGAAYLSMYAVRSNIAPLGYPPKIEQKRA